MILLKRQDISAFGDSRVGNLNVRVDEQAETEHVYTHCPWAPNSDLAMKIKQ